MALPRIGDSNRNLPIWSSTSQAPAARKLDDQFFKEFARALALAQTGIFQRNASQNPHFNPNQPRVPAGNPDGGQWTDTGGSSGRSSSTEGPEPIHSLSPGQVMSDANPEEPRVWSQYAQAGIGHNYRNSAVERTREILTDVLTRVNGRVAARTRHDPISVQLYGIQVHTEFAYAVRALDLPGIGKEGVEQSFNSFGTIVRYGLDGSIRTDVVLRDRSGERIDAIFDVKTGKATMMPATETRYRHHTRVGPDVPLIILHAVRGAGLW